MFRQAGAPLSVLALLFGFVAAPFTHVHQHGATDAHDRRTGPAALLHAHVAAHLGDQDPHHAPAEDDRQDHELKIWAFDGFVFQPAAATAAPPAVLHVCSVTPVHLPGAWSRLHVSQPRAHGPRAAGGSGLRAPPLEPAARS